MADAYPELAPVGAAAGSPVYPRRGRGARPPAGARPRRHRPRRRRRRGRARRRARRRVGRARALRDREGHPRRPPGRHRRRPRRVLPRAGGAAGGRARGRDRGRPLAARLHDQRDGDPAAGRARPDRPPRRPRRPRGGPAPRPPSRTRSATTRPGRCAPPATRRGSGSSSRPRPRRCCARPTSTPSPPIAARPICGGSPPSPRRSAASPCSRQWGLIELRDGGSSSPAVVAELLAGPPWEGVAPRADAILAAALGPIERAEELAETRPRAAVGGGQARPGECDPVELVLARAIGAEWLDRYLLEWRDVSLEIDGADLIAAGVPEGPAVGRGLAAALREKLDGGRCRPRAGARGGARGGGRDRWSGVAKVRSSGSKRGCRAPGSRSRPGPAGSATAPFASLNLGYLTDDETTPWSRTGAGSHRRSASTPIGS